MASEITISIVAGSDDCYRDLISDNWSLGTTAFTVGASTLGNYKIGGGLRFLGIPLSGGDNVISAKLIVTGNGSPSLDPVYSRISIEQVDDAPTFADDKDAYDARWANRGAQVDWDDESPDFASLLQTHIDRSGWQYKNAIVIFFEDHDGRSSGMSRARQMYAYEGSGQEIQLYIQYDALVTPPSWWDIVDQLGFSDDGKLVLMVGKAGDNDYRIVKVDSDGKLFMT